MAIVINGSGTVTGLAVGGLPDGTVDSDTLASGIDKTSISDNGDATAMTIDSSERVGINNSSPTQRLEINGNSQFNMYDNPSGSGGYYTTKGMQIGNAFDAGLSGGDDDRNAIVWNERGTSLLFGTDNIEHMRIDYTGAVTMPKQPAFLATANGSSQTNVGSAETVNFGTEVFDQNSDYNTSTHTFTAPVTGRYYFSGTVRTGELATDANFYRIEIQTSNRNYKFEIIDPDKLYSANPTYHSFHFNSLADMDSGDTASVVLIRNGGTASLDITGSQDYTFWSGHLVC